MLIYESCPVCRHPFNSEDVVEIDKKAELQTKLTKYNNANVP